MSNISKRNILFLFFVLIDLFLIFLIGFFGQKTTPFMISEHIVFPRSSFQGTLQAIMILFCFLIVILNYSTGRIVSVSLIILAILQNIFVMHTSKSFSPLPGVISLLVSLFTIELIARFYKKKAVNSITDIVTGLKNRRIFAEDAQNLVLNKQSFYLANLAIKNFTGIIDAYGLKAGDLILKIVSDRINSKLNKSDILYRIVGSNFVILFVEEKNPEELLEEIIELANKEIVIPKEYTTSGNSAISCYPSLVCGIAKSKDDEKDYIKIFNHSDLALSLARKSNKKSIFVYDDQMQTEQKNQIEAEKLIIESLQKDYFYLVYQPQYDIASKKIRGFETLIRCKKPDGTIVSPAFYIPVAEKTNLILDIDDYVLRRAMKEFKPVLDSLKEKITISINVSAKNISTAGFAEKVKNFLKETNFPPECLELEITEYSLAESMDITIKNINAFRQMGIQIALDDFGTGYTSISQLLKLPINLLKIDKSLVDDIENAQKSLDLVDSVIYMGHIMNCEVISEGVESEAQLKLLKEHKCDFVQGFVWGKPLPYGDAVNLCKANA